MQTKIESTGFVQVGKIASVVFDDANYDKKVELQLGDYELKVCDGKTYAVKKKPKYPTTYEECYDEGNTELHFIYVDKDERDLYESFIQLIRCRNAYWKIAGEQMGLGKSWEPTSDPVYGITRTCNLICTSNRSGNSQLLEFPTEEMRDAFYENFKKVIEHCKELL